MALVDIYNMLYEDTTLQARVIGAAFKAAAIIESEDPATENHAERLTLAKAILDDPKSAVKEFLKHAAANPTIQAEPAKATDGDLEFVVSSKWDDSAKAHVSRAEAVKAEVAAAAALLKP